MATKIGIQRQQEQIKTGVGTLQAASYNPMLPNFSGLNRFANVLLAKHKENKAYDDQQRGIADGNAQTLTGPDGMPDYSMKPRGNNSVDYQRGLDAARINNTTAAIEADINNRLNQIQTQTGVSLEDKQRLMEGVIEGAASGLDPRIGGLVRQRGLDQITSRINRETIKIQNQNEENTVVGIGNRVENQMAAGYQIAKGDGDYGAHVENISQAYDELVSMNRMNEETANIKKKEAANLFYAVSRQSVLVDSIFDGNVSAQEAELFATAVAEGGDQKLTRVIEIDESGQPLITEELSSSEINIKLKDPKMAADFAAGIRRAANLKQEYDRNYAKQTVLFDTIRQLDPDQSLPDALKDDLDKVFQGMISRGAMKNDIPTMLSYVQITKTAPKTLIQTMRNTMQSADHAQLGKTVEMWHRMTSMTNPDGSSVGNIIRADVSETDQDYFDMMSEVYKNTSDDKTLREFQQNLKDPDFSIDAIEKNYNENAKLEDADAPTLDARIRAEYLDKFGARPSLKFVREMKRSYQISKIAGGSEEQTYNNAWKRTAGRYEAAPFLYGGSARVGDYTLTNPEGYLIGGRNSYEGGALRGKSKQPGFDIATGVKSPYRYEWLKNFTKDVITDVLDQVDTSNYTEAELAGIRDALKGEDLFGMLDEVNGNKNQTLMLKPTSEAPNNPTYEVWVKMDGTFQPLEIMDKDGTERKLEINPGLNRAQESAKHLLAEQHEKARLATDGKIADSKMETLKKYRDLLKMDGPMGRGPNNLTYEDFDKNFNILPEGLREEYEGKKSMLEEGFRKRTEKYIEEIEENSQEIPRSNIDLSTLNTAGSKGVDVVDATVAQIESILPDGTGGEFMANIAYAESEGGTVAGTFRTSGDVGVWQINVGSQGAFNEVKRRIGLGNNSVAAGARKIESALRERGINVDLANATAEDLHKPIVSAAFARLYLLGNPVPNPTDVAAQARYWKKYYNTSEGSGTEARFIQVAERYGSRDRTSRSAVSQINFKKGVDTRINPQVATRWQRTQAAFGQEIRIESGFRDKKRNEKAGGAKHSQHVQGNAIDLDTGHLSKTQKLRLIRTAVANGFTGIGVYNNNIHLDIGSTRAWGPTHHSESIPSWATPTLRELGILGT